MDFLSSKVGKLKKNVLVNLTQVKFSKTKKKNYKKNQNIPVIK